MTPDAALPVLRGFRWPWLWVGLWLAMLAAVAWVSLLPAMDLPEPAFDGIDKVEHAFTYFVLAWYAVNLFARRRAQSLAVVGVIALGIALELLQGALTTSRQADSADALANSLGALAGLWLAATPLGRILQTLDGGRRVGP